MGADSDRMTVGDFVTLIRGTTYKGQLVGKPGPALLGLGSIEPGGGFRIEHYTTYGGDCPDELMLFPGDIYASLKGATKDGKMIGSVARVPPSVLSGRLTQDTVKLVFRDPDAKDANYLYWVLRTPQYRHYCAGHAMGSAVVALSRRDFLSYDVPPPTTPRRILVALLDAFEDKIELNRRTNETLETMARVLFKSWFVDFDPVRAKCEGRDPRLPKHIADLFPDSLEDSELGEIPRGWRTGTLGELSFNPQYGFTASAKEKNVGPKFLRITDINKRSWIDWSNVPHCEIAIDEFAKYHVRPGDILIARMADPGHGVMIEENVHAVFASYLIRFRPHDPAFARFLQYWLKSDGYWELVHARHAGTTRASLNAQVLSRFHLRIPPKQIGDAFGKIVTGLRARVIANVGMSATIAAFRDALLPKLISGEIRSNDVEKFVTAIAR